MPLRTLFTDWKRLLLGASLVAALVAGGAALRPASGGASDGRDHAEHEPLEAQPAGPPAYFTDGDTVKGRRFVAVRYPTKGGLECIDIAFENDNGSAGSCFAWADGPGYGVTMDQDGSVVVYGVAPGSREGDSVRFRGAGAGGRDIDIPVQGNGIFAGAVDREPGQPPSVISR